MLTYKEFIQIRLDHQKAYNKKNSWAIGLEGDFESMTKCAYKFYLNGKVPIYAK